MTHKNENRPPLKDTPAERAAVVLEAIYHARPRWPVDPNSPAARAPRADGRWPTDPRSK